MLNRKLPRKTLLALSTVFAIGSSMADDTEIFNSNPSLAATISSPNVLIILDNTSNWGNGANPQPFTDEKAAMTTVIGALAGMRVKANVGLMFQAAGSTDGGYVRFALRPMIDSSGNATTANTRLTNLVNSLDAGNDKANNPTYAQTMAEAFYYFKGLTPRAGFGDIHRDCGATNSNNTYASGLGSYGYTGCGTADPGNTNQFTNPTNSAGVSYISPMSTTDSCQKNYIIYISNGPISNNDGNVEAANNNPGYVLLRDAPASASSGQLATIPASPDDETRVNYADEWARYLFQTDLNTSLDGKQNVITYTINVRPGTTGQGPAHTAMMNSMAVNGGGRPFSAVTQADIEEALMAIFNEIQSVNSVFAAVSLPVSVNVRGINANQVYVGMFRPDADSLPRWPGNLKLYRLGVYNNGLVLSDQRTSDPTNVSAANLSINASTGQFVDQAVSFWTTSSSFWGFNSSIGPASSSTPASDSPDGPVVEKGGVAEVLRNTYASSQSARKVFTCISSCTSSACSACTTSTALTTSNSLTNFASGSTFSGATMQSVFGGSTLGITDDTTLTSLVNWIRGQDNAISPGGENNNNSLTDMRASIHADVLHSRPIVINFGGDTTGDNDVVIFYGSNDGLLRAVKGGYATVSDAAAATNGIAPGSEMWSFVAPEFFSKFVRQRDNSPAVTSESGLTTNTYGSLTTTSGSTTVTGLTSAQALTLARGMAVTGSGIPADTYILGVGSTSFTMTRSATSSSASASLTFTPNPKDYFFDGPIGVYVKDVTSSTNSTPNGVIRASESDQVLLFVPMRRGGRWLYAFDVTTPTAPVFKWRIGCNNQGTCSGIDSELGETWSEPKVVKIKANDTTSTGCTVATPCVVDKYVIVMGAGYDANVEDRDPIPNPLPSGVSRTRGRGIYVLDIADGSVVWKAQGGASYAYTASLATVPGMDYAIPSDITVIDRNGDGYADRAYVGDTGGNVWRVDMLDADRVNWRVNKFASIGRAQFLADSSLLVAPANGENNDINGNTRKFLSPPDVVPASGYDAILIGSGDREHPFNGYGDTKHPVSQAVQNRYYMFKDFDIGAYACNSALGGAYSSSTFTCASDAVLHETQLANVTTSASASLGSLKGWFISLGLGEKLTGSSVTLSGSTFFNTNIPTPPAAGVCSSNLGEARQYAVSYLTGGAAFDRNSNSTVDFVSDRYSAISSGGFLPSPVGLIVSIGGKLYQGIASGPNIQTPGGLKIGDRIKSYWRKRID